ncbi:DeoR/GlpR family DNA-binding transcription regulator [Paenibacillus koleovorans]|uniref:DeoR/GlpR family DNA-binding transcription regulator n=1 Tax=Paenibacillus koleovorans TaxID=121608 RepID=UPI000FDB7DD8|nr:DeoR/GlpR family DNA-binding transcription regulator [Paenibacillus koleovorans]
MTFPPLKRHEKIMELLFGSGEVKVNELSALLDVTGKTIREDLERLEEQGLLVRVHGGALLKNRSDLGLLPQQAPNARHLPEKADVARIAVQLIEPNDIIALDGGSTTLEMAKLLDNVPLTVLTNDLFIIAELARKDRIRLIVPGGHRNRNMLVSPEAVTFMARLNIRKAFLSATAIHPEYGMTIYTGELLDQKQAMLEAAERAYCVADHTKFDKCALLTFAKLNEVYALITDSGLTSEMAEKYEAVGAKLIRGPL